MSIETEVARLVVRLVADTKQYTAEFMKAGATIKGYVASASASLRKLGAKMSATGKMLTTRLTLPLVAFAAGGLLAFGKFDSEMTKSTSIMKVTAEQTEKMAAVAKSLAAEGPQGPEQLAEAYFFLASAGKDAEQSMSLLPTVQKFATAGAFDLALATDLLTDAQSAMGLSSKNAQKDMQGMSRLADVLVKANTLANASVQQISESLTNDAGPTMKNFNIELEEGVAVLAAYADQGIKGNEAGSMFGRMLRLLTSAALENGKAFEEMNIRLFDDEGQIRLTGVIEDLQRELGDLSPQMKAVRLEQLGFNALAQKAILPLIGTTDAIKGYHKALKDAGGTTKDVSDKQMKSLANRVALLKNEFKLLMMDIGERLVPFLEKLMEKIRDGIKWWDNQSEATKEWVIQLGLVTAAIGPLMWALGPLIVAISRLPMLIYGVAAAFAFLAANPIILVITTLTLAAIALGNALGDLINWLSGVEDQAAKTAAEVRRLNADSMEFQRQLQGKHAGFFNDVASLSNVKDRLLALGNEINLVSHANDLERKRLTILREANVVKQASGQLSAEEIAHFNAQNDTLKTQSEYLKQLNEEYQRQFGILEGQEKLQANIKEQLEKAAKDQKLEIPVELLSKADQIKEAVKTPFEKASEELKDARKLFDLGEINLIQFSKYSDQVIKDFVADVQSQVDENPIEFTPHFGPIDAISAHGSAALTRIDEQQFEIQAQKDMALKKDSQQTPEQKSLASIDDKTQKMVDALQELLGVQREQESFTAAGF